MGLFRRAKKHPAAYPAQERAEVALEEDASEPTGVGGLIEPRPTRFGGGEHDRAARYEVRAEADPESDGAQYEAIQAERHHLERGD